MAHNLTEITNDAIIFNGKKLAHTFLARQRIWDQGDVWHGLGGAGDFTAYEGLRVFDPTGKYDPVMKPLYLEGGDVSNFALVGIESDGIFTPYKGYPVATGAMERDDWAALNKGLPYQRATKFELVAPSTVAMIFDRMTAESNNGKPITIDTVGLLGRHGSDGFFFSVRLPDWDANVASELGTNVEEYLFVVIHPTGRMWVGNGSQIVVCQNTAMAAINGASRMLKTGHMDGATDRIREAMANVYGTALEARQLVQDAAIKLNRKKITRDDARAVANKVYSMPREIDITWIAKSPLETRQQKFAERAEFIEAKREFVTRSFEDKAFHEFAGITPEMRGSAFSLWQIITALETYAPVGRKSPEAVRGVRANGFLHPMNAASRRITEQAFKELVAIK